MAETAYSVGMFTFTVRPREAGIGWEIDITTPGPFGLDPVTFTTDPIYDPTLLVAEVARLSARMALGREV